MAASTLQPGTAPANAPARPISSHALSRRGALSLAALVPLAACPMTPAPAASTSAFAAAERAWRRAHAIEREFYRSHMSPATDAYDAARRQWPLRGKLSDHPGAAEAMAAADAVYRPIDEQHERVRDEAWDKLEAMIQTPAATAADLACKLEVAMAEEYHDLVKADEWTRAFLADARALAAQGRA